MLEAVEGESKLLQDCQIVRKTNCILTSRFGSVSVSKKARDLKTTVCRNGGGKIGSLFKDITICTPQGVHVTNV